MFLSGSGVGDCDGIGVDPQGNAYLGCHSDSPRLEAEPSFAYAIKGGLDAFVMKLTADGRRVEYLTQIAGSGWEAVMDVAVAGSGHAYLVGTTYSPDLPTTPVAPRRVFGGGEGDVLAARLAPNGAIQWLTYIGGRGLDDGRRSTDLHFQ